HTRWPREWSSDVCSSDLAAPERGTADDVRQLMRSAEFERRGPFNSAFRIPHSALAVEHRRLFRAPGRREPKVLIRGSRGAAAAGDRKSVVQGKRVVVGAG